MRDIKELNMLKKIDIDVYLARLNEMRKARGLEKVGK